MKDCEISWYRVARWESYQVVTARWKLKVFRNFRGRQIFRREDEVNVSKECIRRLKKVLKSKLIDGNLFLGVNTWAVTLLRYLAAFDIWRKSESQAIDRKTRKLFTIYGALHPKSDVDRLFIPIKEGGRGLRIALN